MFLIYWHPFIKEVILLIFSSLCNTVILQKEKLFYSKKQHGTASPSRLMLQNPFSKKDATQCFTTKPGDRTTLLWIYPCRGTDGSVMKYLPETSQQVQNPGSHLSFCRRKSFVEPQFPLPLCISKTCYASTSSLRTKDKPMGL